MQIEDLVLEGNHIRLEPLAHRHIDGLVEAAAADPSLYRWTLIPQGKEGMTKYVETALAQKEAGASVPFATLCRHDSVVVGSTRFCYVEKWSWHEGHPRYRGRFPDACEIGFTWLSGTAIRTSANTEAKYLMLRHAFETWDVLRVCLHTDARNARSRAAIERIGAKFEGVLRSHRMSADYAARDSARYSIVAAEWSEVKERLISMMERN